MPEQSALEQNLAPIRKHVLDAVKVMFDRVALDPHPLANKDSRETLQDCEFGMILLLVNKWFRSQSLETEFFAAIDNPNYERVVLDLVRRVVTRVVIPTQDKHGGEGNGICFFTGEPYTVFEIRNVPTYAAHLDAAIITFALLDLVVDWAHDD